MKKYKLMIRLSNGNCQWIYIDADTTYNAQKLAEMQYGKTNIVHNASYVSG